MLRKGVLDGKNMVNSKKRTQFARVFVSNLDNKMKKLREVDQAQA
jgi:hypothetical protein